MFARNEDRIAAEATVRAGAASGNWQACGLALVVDRLDHLTGILEDSGVLAPRADEDGADDGEDLGLYGDRRSSIEQYVFEVASDAKSNELDLATLEAYGVHSPDNGTEVVAALRAMGETVGAVVTMEDLRAMGYRHHDRGAPNPLAKALYLLATRSGHTSVIWHAADFEGSEK